MCPDLEQDQRIELIQLIKGALQARVDQLEAANKATQAALADLQEGHREVYFTTLIAGSRRGHS